MAAVMTQPCTRLFKGEFEIYKGGAFTTVCTQDHFMSRSSHSRRMMAAPDGAQARLTSKGLQKEAAVSSGGGGSAYRHKLLTGLRSNKIASILLFPI